MYPSRELRALALRKAALHQRIAVSRWECVSFAGNVSRPIAWVDRAVAQWKKISPFAKIAAVPLGLLLRRRKLVGGRSVIGQLLRWAPVAFSAARMFKARSR